jgi:hypothetical protein
MPTVFAWMAATSGGMLIEGPLTSPSWERRKSAAS